MSKITEKYRSRQESTDSLNSSHTTEEYSEDDKDAYDIDDYQIIKTVGELYFLFLKNYSKNFVVR